MKLKLGFLSLLFVLPVSPGTWAEESQQVYTLEEVDVYGQRVGISNKQLPPNEITDIHNSGEIGRSLDHESGLETQGEGKGKTWNTLAIRGQSFRETVVLVNGQRVSESFNLGTIPTENIERVEVLEGPQALVYGSDALGGVINVITRKAAGNPFRFQASGGDFNTYQFQLSAPSFGLKDFHNTLSGSYFTTDGYAPLPPGMDANGVIYAFTDQVHWDVNHEASMDLGSDKITLSSGFFRHTGSAPDADNVIAAGTDQYDLDGRQDAWGIQSVLRDIHSMGKWQSTFSLFGNYSDVLRSNPIGADPTSGVYSSYRNQYLNTGGQVYFSGPTDDFLPQLTLGLEAADEDIWSGLYANHSRKAGSLVTGGTLKLDERLRLDLSNRLEDYTTNGLVDNPTGTLVFSPSAGWQIHLSMGKGYKRPTYDELYLPPTNFAILPPAQQAQFNASPFVGVWAGDKGNPNLRPEQSINTELGTDLKAGDFLLQLAGFANFYQDLINPAVDLSDNFWTYLNIDHALFAGTEDSVRVKLADWASPYTSITWIRATDDAGNYIQGRMRIKFTVGVDLKPEKECSLGVNARYVDRYQVATQYLTDLGKPATSTDYWNLDAELKYTISEHLKGFINLENILNQQMASFQGIPLPGRTFEGGVQAQF